MTDSLPLVHFRHARMIRRAGDRPLCRSGVQAWCERHGVDWSTFTTEGVPGEQFAAIGDPYAAKALRHAIEEAARGQ